MVAKRLAQCLNPTSRDLAVWLPGLSSTLSFASLSVRPAFLSLLEHHLLRVHPTALRPALRALILALLPGLEDETGDEFERVLRIVDTLRGAVNGSRDILVDDPQDGPGDEYFWQCFFLASMTSTNRRQGALAFLVRRLPAIGTAPMSTANRPNPGTGAEHVALSPAVEAVVSPEPGLLVRCFAAGLADEQILIQRGFLDLLVTHLPLHSTVLQQRVTPDDLERLISAAVGVVARKDMSLNRRLWAWVLGPDLAAQESGDDAHPLVSPTSDASHPTSTRADTQKRYFARFGVDPLVRAIRKTIDRRDVSSADRARPFRVCLSLMDRWEVGGLVIPAIFLPALESVRQYDGGAPTRDDFGDVLKSASVFFDGVESALIWREMLNLLLQAIDDSSSSADARLDRLQLVRFIITHFNVREEEMLMLHIPLVALALLTALAPKHEHSERRVTAAALTVADTLLEMVPERAFMAPVTPNVSTPLARQEHERTLQDQDVLHHVRVFYDHSRGNRDASGPPLSAAEIANLLLREVTRLIKSALQSSVLDERLEIPTKLLIALLRKTPERDLPLAADLFPIFHQTLTSSSSSHDRPLPFPTFSALVSIINALSIVSSPGVDPPISELIPALVRQAWFHLSPWRPKYHVEVVRCLWQLQSAMGDEDHCIEAALCTLMVEHDINGTFGARSAMPGRKLAILWSHSFNSPTGLIDQASTGHHRSGARPGSGYRVAGRPDHEVTLLRPLFLLLDALDDERSELFVFVRTWLQSIPGVDR